MRPHKRYLRSSATLCVSAAMGGRRRLPSAQLAMNSAMLMSTVPKPPYQYTEEIQCKPTQVAPWKLAALKQLPTFLVLKNQ